MHKLLSQHIHTSVGVLFVSSFCPLLTDNSVAKFVVVGAGFESQCILSVLHKCFQNFHHLQIVYG